MISADFIGSVFSGVDAGYITLARFAPGGGLLSTRLPATANLGVVDDYVQQYRETLYYNISIGREYLPENIRGSKQSLSCACMLWADVDLPKEASEKKYPTFEAIRSALDDMPLRYSILVHTGGGYHVYWLLNQPYEFNNVEDVVSFENKFSKPWQNLLRVKLAQYGNYSIDSTHDATRMLRIPGSWHKNGKQCVVEEADYDRRYDRADFEPYLEMIRVDSLIPKQAVNIEGDIKGLVDPGKLDALKFNSNDFKKVWERKRTFESPSETDASLAYHGVTAGWSDEEIANLIVSFNRTYKIDRTDARGRDKMTRVDYLSRTIALVRESRARDCALLEDDDIEEPASESNTADVRSDAGQQDDPDAPVADKPVVSEDKKSEYIKKLSQFFDIPIARWIQVGREEPIYTLVLTDGRQIKIGGENDVVHSSRIFEARIFSELHKRIVPVPKGKWFTICKFLAAIVELIDAPETSSRDQAIAGIVMFLETQSVMKENVKNEAIKNNKVWHDAEALYVHVGTVVHYLNIHGGGRKWKNGEFVNAIRQAGFVTSPQTYRTTGSHSTKSYWRAPLEQFSDSIKNSHLGRGVVC